MLLHHRGDAAQHQQGFVLARLMHLHDLEAAGQRRVFLDVFFVFGPGGGGDGAQRAARQGGLEQIGGVAGAGRAARADQRVRLVDEEHNRLGAGLHLVDDLPQALLKLAFHARPGLQQTEIQSPQGHVSQGRRHLAGGDFLREAFDDGGLADAGLAGQDGVVLAAAHQDVDQLADFLVAPGDGVHLAASGLFGQIDGVAVQGFLAGWGGGRRGGFGGPLGRFLGRAGENHGAAVGQFVGVDFFELRRDVEQMRAQGAGFQQADQQMGAAHLGFVK